MSDHRGSDGTILVGIDFSAESEQALAWAAWLARHTGARLCLAHAVLPVEAAEGLLELAPASAGSLLDTAMLQLDTLARQWRSRAPAISTAVRFGQPSTVLLDLALSERPQVLVVGTRGLRGWRHVLLGSTAERVLTRATVPVLAVHGDDGEPDGEPVHLLAATDFSADAAQALRAAVRLFHGCVVDVTLLHAFEPPPFVPPVEGELVALRTRDAARLAAAVRLKGQVQSLQREGIAVIPELREGTPLEAITAASVRAGTVVVMGSHGHSDPFHLPLGSVAKRVAQRASAPVLVLPRAAWSAPAELELEPVFAGEDEQC